MIKIEEIRELMEKATAHCIARSVAAGCCPHCKAEVELSLAAKRIAAFAISLDAECRRHEWQPIETAPKDGSIIQGWIGVPWLFSWQTTEQHPNGVWHGVTPYEDRFALMWVRMAHVNQPTYWMPLPSPPTSTQDDEKED